MEQVILAQSEGEWDWAIITNKALLRLFLNRLVH